MDRLRDIRYTLDKFMSQNNQLPYRLMTPGPVPVPAAVLQATSAPMLHHRTPEFMRIFKRVLVELQRVFQTRQPVMMLASTGSGAMEAAIVNTLSPGDEVLCVDSGKFGERWADMAMAYGVKVTRLKVPWGEAVKVSDIDLHLNKNPNLKAVLTQACETSTATLHPLKEIAACVAKYPHCLLMVDAITALAATPLPMDEWGLDVVIAGSQKALMLPTGMAFIALSKKAWEANASSACPRYYWDLKREHEANLKGQSFFSTAVNLVRGLDVVLEEFKKRGLESYVHRCEKLAAATRTAAAHLHLATFSAAPSPSVTALLTPHGIDSEKLRDHLEAKYNISVMGGQDQLKGKVIRIGHLGAITEEDLLATIKYLGKSLIDLDFLKISEADIDTAVNLAREKMHD